MKKYISTATTPYKYNQNQTEVGSALKTLKGSRISRSKYGVGKEIGGSIYVHKQYADEVIPNNVLLPAKITLKEKYPNFKYNCIRYDTNTDFITFNESPNFDIAREPVVGDYITIKPDGTVKTGHSNYIWHHKWLFVRNDYTGFNVADSWNWSKQWLSTLEEPSDGNGIDRWNAQLSRYNLPKEGEMMKIRSNSTITAAIDDTGTTFYKVTVADLVNHYKESNNIVTSAIIDMYEFDVFDLDRMYGSAIIDDTLYLCVTDNKDIIVDGEAVDPEHALEEYDIEDLEDYIEPATDEVLNRYASYYEFDPSKIDIDEVAAELLNGGHHLTQIIEDMTDIDLLDDILY